MQESTRTGCAPAPQLLVNRNTEEFVWSIAASPVIPGYSTQPKERFTDLRQTTDEGNSQRHQRGQPLPDDVNKLQRRAWDSTPRWV